MQTALVFGASGAVGRFLLPLLDTHYKVIAASRAARPDWIQGDLNDTVLAWPTADIVISLGPLDAFAAWLQRQPTGPRRIVALSSMSAETKRESSDPAERELAARLRASESTLFAAAAASGAACTIFRPTLIYGAGVDRSLARIARFATRWHVLPIPLGASGLRQPVHARDLAAACASVVTNPATHGKVYALGGGECLRFDALLWRLRGALPGFTLPLPLPLWGLRVLEGCWRGGPLHAGALARLREPLVADNGPAQRDFGYTPGPFRAADVRGPLA